MTVPDSDEYRELMEGDDSLIHRDEVTGNPVLDPSVLDGYRPSPYEIGLGDETPLSFDPSQQRERYSRTPRKQLDDGRLIEDDGIARYLILQLAHDRGRRLDDLRASAEKRGRRNGYEQATYDLFADAVHELTRTNDPDREYALSLWAVADAIGLKDETVKLLKQRGLRRANRQEAAVFRALSLAKKARSHPRIRSNEKWNPDFQRSLILDKHRREQKS